MQQMILVKEGYTYKINEILEQGWKVVSVTPAIKCVGKYDTPFCGVYVVVEKESGGKDA